MNKVSSLAFGSVLASGGALVFVVVVFPLHFTQPEYDAKSQLMSELALGPYGWAMTLAFAGLSLSAAGAALVVRGGNGAIFLRWLFFVAAFFFLIAGIFPLGRFDGLHIAAIACAFVIAVLAIYLFPAHAGKSATLLPKPLSVSLASSVAISVFLGHAVLEMGIAQRLAAACLLAWFFAVGLAGWRSVR